jgi:hypothetical protein
MSDVACDALLPSSLVRAACHEASHATLAVIHHLPVRRVWVRDDGDGRTEFCRQFTVAESEIWVTVTMAGPIGEAMICGGGPGF